MDDTASQLLVPTHSPSSRVQHHVPVDLSMPTDAASGNGEEHNCRLQILTVNVHVHV